MRDPAIPDLPAGLTAPARRELGRFQIDCAKTVKKLKGKPLNILVWGRNLKSTSSVAKKRRDIRKQLLRLGHNAMFSEELPCFDGKSSAKTKEFAEALNADLIFIMVEGAPGALGEAHDFSWHPNISPKLYIWVPRRYEKGYSANGAIQELDDGFNHVFWYEPKHVKRCDLLKRAVRLAEGRRNARQYLKVSKSKK